MAEIVGLQIGGVKRPTVKAPQCDRQGDVVQWAGTPQLSKIDLTEEETQ